MGNPWATDFDRLSVALLPKSSTGKLMQSNQANAARWAAFAFLRERFNELRPLSAFEDSP